MDARHGPHSARDDLIRLQQEQCVGEAKLLRSLINAASLLGVPCAAGEFATLGASLRPSLRPGAFVLPRQEFAFPFRPTVRPPSCLLFLSCLSLQGPKGERESS